MKTEQQIKKAFATLVEQHPYTAIQVKDIVASADIARATFYLYFQTKEALLIHYIDDLFQSFYDDVELTLNDVDRFDEVVTIKMFELFESEASFCQLLGQASVRPILYARFQSYLARIFGRMMRASGVAMPDKALVQYAIDYCAAGSLELLVSWVDQKFAPSPDVMGRMYFSLIGEGVWSILGLTMPPNRLNPLEG